MKDPAGRHLYVLPEPTRGVHAEIMTGNDHLVAGLEFFAGALLNNAGRIDAWYMG